MGRNRSPSPPRRVERRRSPPRDQIERRRSPPRDRRHRHTRRSRSRSPLRKRSRSPQRRRSRSRSPGRRRSSSPFDEYGQSTSVGGKKGKEMQVNPPQVNEEDLEGMDPESADMMRMMGFSGFDTTKGKKVEGNDISSSNIITKRKFRQYMNRRGGFNRPLDFIA